MRGVTGLRLLSLATGQTLKPSVALVKQLRDSTGAPLNECKRALDETGGSLELALEKLKQKGVAVAQKLDANRVTSQGLIGMSLSADGSAGVLLELKSETDFVARNERFQDLTNQVADAVLEHGPVSGELETSQVLALKLSSENVVVSEAITEAVSVIREKIELGRVSKLAVDEAGAVVGYLHNRLRPGVGEHAALVAIKSEADKEALLALGKRLAMHIVAAEPTYLHSSQVPLNIIDEETEKVLQDPSLNAKPEAAKQNIIKGKLNKYFSRHCLLNQEFALGDLEGSDAKLSVSELLQQESKRLGRPVQVSGFARLKIGCTQ